MKRIIQTSEVMNNKESLSKLLSENTICEMKEMVLMKPKVQQECYMKQFLELLTSTKDPIIRNHTAILLSDLKCVEAIDPIMELIATKENSNQRGSLIYALNGFTLNRSQILILFPLLFEGNFEVRMEVFNCIKAHINVLSCEDIDDCLTLLGEEIDDIEFDLSLLHEVKKRMKKRKKEISGLPKG